MNRYTRLKQTRRPVIVSAEQPIAVLASPATPNTKRVSRVRMSWFVVGSLFGIGVSFFMSLLVSTVVIPTYKHFRTTAATIETATVSPVIPTEAAAISAPAVSITPEPAMAKAPEAVPAAPKAPEATYPIKLALKISHKQSLLEMLVAHKVPVQEATNVINALKSKFNPKQLQAGQQVSVTLARHETVGDGAAVSELAIKLPNMDMIELERLQSGKFNVEAKLNESARSLRRVGKVRSSFSQAAKDAGIPSAAMAEILKAYSYDIDFQREIHPGDTIEVLMEPKVDKTAGTVAFGGPRYAVLTLQGKKHEIFRFKNEYGDYAWFDAKGNSVKKSLLRTPLSVVHITSGFGMRNHPLLGYTKMHKGVDFGAATGTPIMAAGDGTVEFKGWQNGYGNFVVIKHNNTYETAYGHMSRFANISEGNRIKQGQIIGYVGMTGGATGPHLHYEVRQNETQVNPVAKQFNMNNSLSGKQLASFIAGRQSAINELASLSGKIIPKSKIAAVASTEPSTTTKAAKKASIASKSAPLEKKKVAANTAKKQKISKAKSRGPQTTQSMANAKILKMASR